MQCCQEAATISEYANLQKIFKNDAGEKKFRHSTFGDMCMGELGGVCKVDIKEISTSIHLEVNKYDTRTGVAELVLGVCHVRDAIGSNIGFNIGFNIGVEYWVQYRVQYLGSILG